MTRNRALTVVLALVAMTIWGASFVGYKLAYLGFHPLGLISVRLICAVIVLGVWLTVSRSWQKIRPQDWKWFILTAFFEPFLYFIGESYGMLSVSPTVGSLMIATIPLITAVVASRFLHEKLTKGEIGGLILSFAGVTLIVSAGASGGASPRGVALMFLAVISAVVYGFMVKVLSRNYHGLTIVFLQSLIGLLLFLPLFLFLEGSSFTLVMPREALISALALGVLASGVAYVFLNISIRNLGLSASNVMVNLIPVLAAVFGRIVLHESFTPAKLFGGGLVLAGVALAQVFARKR
jgi:drug/metabolite transporter (DMT)-like permease